MTQLTPQQATAVETKAVSVLLSSGAGCGKTHVLTERYLSHLREDRAEVQQIVAITFTDRAARQMRGRIRQAVIRHLRDAPSDEQAEVWAKHLRGLETAPISTIHAFCGNILRQHAIEAKLDPGFEVLEDVLSVNLETEAMQLALQHLLTAQSEAGEDLRQLVLLYGWRTVVTGVEALLSSWDEKPWLAWLQRDAKQIGAQWLEEAESKLLPRFLAHITSTKRAFAETLALLRKHPPLTPEMAANVHLLLDELPDLAKAKDLGSAVDRLHEAAKVGRIGKKAWPDPDVYESIKSAFDSLRKALKDLPVDAFTVALSEPDSSIDAELEKAIVVGRRLIRVVREVMQTYEQRKRIHSVVDFQDLLLLTRNLLRDHREVRQRLQERYRFLLIDELQDTDPVQMELIESLCGAELTQGKLFTVGDANQSIYRFRGADVSRFQALKRKMPPQGRLDLTVNFRSQPAILDFANALLGHRLADYEHLRAFHEQINAEACVEFLWAPRGEGSTTQGRIVESDWIARRLANMIGQESLVVDREGNAQSMRKVRAGDVVLLFRSMSNVHLYEAALRRYGLNYYLVGGRAFFAQQEIYDILNLLRALENPQDSVSLAGTLRSPFCCLSDEALFVFSRSRDGIWAGLHDTGLWRRLPADQRDRAERARRNLSRWHLSKDRMPIARLLERVFTESGFDAATQFEPLPDRKLANLWKIVDLARTFDRSGLFGLAEFIDRLGDLVANQSREEQAATQPENADVIRIMSIHQAKGLEFPVVVIPDLVTRGGPRYVPIASWDESLGCVVRPPSDTEPAPFPALGWKVYQTQNDLAEWEEDLRTLYVACTRARDYLILSAALPEDYKPDTAWMHTLTERFDLTTGQCLVADLDLNRVPKVRVTDVHHPPRTLAKLPKLDVEPSSSDLLWREVPVTGDISTKELRLADLCDKPLSQHPLRRVLSRWDFGDVTGWKQHLPDAETATYERWLTTFAESDLYSRLVSATRCQRDVLVQVDLSCIEGGSSGMPTITGRADCLWRDDAAEWHVVCFSFEQRGKLQDEWNAHLPELVMTSLAVKQMTGAYPRSVRLHNVAKNKSLERTGTRLPYKKVVEGSELTTKSESFASWRRPAPNRTTSRTRGHRLLIDGDRFASSRWLSYSLARRSAGNPPPGCFPFSQSHRLSKMVFSKPIPLAQHLLRRISQGSH